MNLRSTILLGLFCVAAPAVANAYPIAAERSLDPGYASPAVYPAPDGLNGVTTFDESVAVIPDRAADRLRDRWEIKGIPDARLQRAGETGDIAPASGPLLTATSTSTVVSVSEPATLGLLGLGIAMLSLGTRRLGGNRLRARSLGAGR